MRSPDEDPPIMSDAPPVPLRAILQEALWRWPGDAGAATRLREQLLSAAPGALPAGASEAATGWVEDLASLSALTPTERAMVLARGQRLLMAGELVERAPTGARPVATKGGRRRVGPRGKAAAGAAATTAAEALPPGLRPPPAPELIGLKGCGPRTAERLAARGICDLRDLLGFLPLHYEDRRHVRPLGEVLAGQGVLTRGTVQSQGWRGRGGRRFYELVVTDGEATLLCRWFRAWPGIAQRAANGAEVVVSGTAREWQGRLQMAHPTLRVLEPGEAPGAEGIVPRYGPVEGVAPAVLRRLCAQVAAAAEDLTSEPLPPALREALGLPGRAEAFRGLHLPDPALGEDDVAALEARRSLAHQRIIFDELFLSQLALARRRRQIQAEAARPCPLPSGAGAVPAGTFPFTLTGAQERVIREIAEDLARPEPMQRLVQGDVGSGKTAVAFAAAAQVLAAGGQVAFMAPTEILAAQHHATLVPWMARLGLRLALLTASTPRGARESTLALLAAGQIHLVLGTHALLAERVGFAELGLVIVDEQHRFGVAQRARLRDKGAALGGHSPHLLVMTATPIPRTLALTVYGDLDLSVVDELPPGRVSPATHVFPVGKRAKVYERVLAHLAEGRRAFVVCPLVGESEVLDVADAERTHADLVDRLAPHPVGLLHGRLPADQKAAILTDFREGRLSVLVATTVVEVGVDIPDAELMVVESAQRFGLAQLHQLRGRVGRRAGAEALCLLISDRGATPEARRRLQVMKETADGFRIAEEDLKIRGPGELLGLRQAGGNDLGLAGAAAHPRLLAEARRAAQALVAEDPDLTRPEHAMARDLLEARWTGRLFGEESG